MTIECEREWQQSESWQIIQSFSGAAPASSAPQGAELGAAGIDSMWLEEFCDQISKETNVSTSMTSMTSMTYMTLLATHTIWV